MSQEKGEEREQGDSLSEEFNFYFPFAKTLALDLTSPEDTSIAAAWVQKLEAEPETEEEKQTRLNYLKLLLFVLQRGRLTGIFRKQPPEGALQPFPPGLTFLDMGNLMLDQDDTPSFGEGDARYVPYTIEVSNDLREFVASQEVPNFGIQMYYAWSSDEPVHKWLSFDEEKFPQYILDKIKQLKEIKSEEKSSIVKNGCKKKACELPVLEKCSKRRVKTPQEIETCQGRSFHTYMGLVGQMGNFEKCDEESERCQRRAKCQRGNGRRRLPGNGGEAADMQCEGEFSFGYVRSGDVSSQNATYGYSYQNQQANCPKGGQQPFENQQNPSGQCGRPENSIPHCTSPGGRPPSRQGSPEMMNAQQMQMRRSPSPRAKSGSPGRSNDCAQQDNPGGGFSGNPMCSCSMPPCTCPCPRSPRGQSPNAPCGGGKVASSSNYSYPKQGGGKYQGNVGETCGNVFEEPGPSTCPQGPVNRGTDARTKRPVVTHCYDAGNPDPVMVLQKKIVSAPPMSPALPPHGRVKAMQQRLNLCATPSNLKLQPPPRGRSSRSPSPGNQAACGPPQQPQQQQPQQQQSCRQPQFTPSQCAQNFQPAQTAFSDPCRRQQTTPYRPTSEPIGRQKNMPCPSGASYGTNTMQMFKQKTEAIREKYDQMSLRKSPVSDAGYCQPSGQVRQNPCLGQQPNAGASQGPNYYNEGRSPRNQMFNDPAAYMKPQSSQMPGNAGKCIPPGREYENLPHPMQAKVNFTTQLPKRQPVPSNQPCPPSYANIPQQVCPEGSNDDDDGEEEDYDCASSDSMEVSPQGNAQKFEGQPCPQPKPSGRPPQQFAQQGVCNVGNMQAGYPQGVMPGRVQQDDGRYNMAPVAQTCEPQQLYSRRSPKPQQPNYVECETQNVPSKRYTQGKAGLQNQTYVSQTSASSGSRKSSPGRRAQAEACGAPTEWEEMPCSVSQMAAMGLRPANKGDQTQCLPPQQMTAEAPPCPPAKSPPRKKSPPKGTQKCQNEWFNLVSDAGTESTGQTYTESGGYSSECPVSEFSGRTCQTEGSSSKTCSPPQQSCPPQNTNPRTNWQQMTEPKPQSFSPQGNTSSKSSGSPQQSCPPQNVGADWQPMCNPKAPPQIFAPQGGNVVQTYQMEGQAKVGFPAQNANAGVNWQPIPDRKPNVAQDFAPQGNPPSWQMMADRNPNAPREATPPANTNFLTVPKEREVKCPPIPNPVAQKPSSRTPSTQNNLSRQKSSPKQSQSITRNTSKTVQKPTPAPSKSQVQNMNGKKPTTAPTSTTRNKSNISIKSKSQVSNAKSKSKSRTSFKSVPLDLIFDSKRKPPPKRPDSGKCYTQQDMADLKCLVQLLHRTQPRNVINNPYADQSDECPEAPMVAFSSPRDRACAVQEGTFPDLSCVEPYEESDCNVNQMPQEAEPAEEYEFIEISGGMPLENLLQILDQPNPGPPVAQCQDLPQQGQKIDPPRSSCQSFQENEYYTECENPRGFY